MGPGYGAGHAKAKQTDILWLKSAKEGSGGASSSTMLYFSSATSHSHSWSSFQVVLPNL